MYDIGWLVSNVLSSNVSEVTNSELASSRMRAGACINAALKNGYSVAELNLTDNSLPNVVFIAKFVPDSGTGRFMHDGGCRRGFWLDLIAKMKSQKKKVIVDYTDHHLVGVGPVASFYKEIADFVDGYVVPSNQMKKNIQQCLVNKPIWVIPEPVEARIVEPKLKRVNRDVVNLLWFGHNSNLPYLYKLIETKLKFIAKYHLLILSNHIDQKYFAAVASRGAVNARYSYAKWTLPIMEKLATQSDLCLIPGDLSDPKKNGVSSGRLLTSLAMGLPTVAEPLNSYMEFKDFFVPIDSDLTQIVSNPAIMCEPIKEAQKVIANNYTVDSIGNLWLEAYSEVMGC